MAWTPVCSADELAVGESQAFDLGDRVIALYNVEGQFFATSDRCTHEEASLAEGFLEDHLIECPLHGSQFDLRTGEVLSLPAVIPVKTYSVKVDGEQVLVDV